jgi:hypothetical protein
MLHQEQMASRGHRKVFGQTLDDTKHCRLDKVEMHELLRKFADAVRAMNRLALLAQSGMTGNEKT